MLLTKPALIQADRPQRGASQVTGEELKKREESQSNHHHTHGSQPGLSLMRSERKRTSMDHTIGLPATDSPGALEGLRK